MSDLYIGLTCGGFIGFFSGLILAIVILFGMIRDNCMPGREDEEE